MGTGGEIGSRLRAWLQQTEATPLQPRLLEAFLLDHLGDETRLRGPLRDLASRPVLPQLLREPSPAVRRSLLDALDRDLSEIYAPVVRAELLDLLEAASGLAPAAGADSRPALPPPAAATRAGTAAGPAVAADPSGPGSSQRRRRSLARALHPLAPGLALAFLAALVLAWLGGELMRLLPASWSGGLVLTLLLWGVHLLLLPLPRFRQAAALRLVGSGDPHRAWRWITAPWVHLRHGEALLNGVVLLMLLGGSPLPLPQLVLRYLLSSLAAMAAAVLLARRWLRRGLWDGATGAVAALIGLATGASLLHWRPISFPFTLLAVPSWVLLVVYGAIQMAWILPRRSRQDPSTPLQRLLCSGWWWGSLYGLLWAVISRLLEWIGPLGRSLLQGLLHRS